MKPTPQEVLRALGDGKVVETDSGRDYLVLGQALYSRDKGGLCHETWDELTYVFNAATRIIDDHISRTENKAMSVREMRAAHGISGEGRSGNPEFLAPEPVTADEEYPYADKAVDVGKMLAYLDAQKAKDKLLLEMLSALNHLLGVSSLSVDTKTSVAAMLQTYARKAFPEES